MAKYIDGELVGVLGELVAYKTRHGKFVRRRPKRTKPPTPRELETRYNFALANAWLKPIAEFVKKGFRGYSEKCEGRQAAISELYRNGLEKKGLESVIHPEQVLLSWGELPLPEELSMQKDDAQLRFGWSTELGPGAGGEDRIMLLAYNPETGKADWELSGPKREAGAGSLSLKWLPAGEYHVYAAFAAAEGERQSRSRYLGKILR